MRVLQITPTTSFGGTQRIVEWLSVGFSDRGHDVLIVHGSRRPCQFGELPASHARIRQDEPWTAPLGSAQLGAIIRRWQPDVVLAHHRWAAWLALPWARRHRLPVVLHVHHPPNQRRWWVPWPEEMIAVSRFVRDRLVAVGADPARITVVPNGVPRPALSAADVLRARTAMGPAPVVGLFVGRLAAGKGLDVLVEALKLAPDVVIAVLGDGPLLGMLQEAGLGLGGRLNILGWTDDPAPFLAAADFLVVPSTADEGFGLSVAEALAVGTPVVVTDRGALREIVNGSFAIPVKAGDARALAEALLEMVREPARRESRARAAQRKSGELSVDRMTTGVYEVLQRAASTDTPC